MDDFSSKPFSVGTNGYRRKGNLVEWVIGGGNRGQDGCLVPFVNDSNGQVDS